MDKKTGIVTDNKYLWHKAPGQSKECPERLSNIYENLKNFDYLEKLRIYSPREASDDEVCSVHSKFYFKQILEYSLNKNPYSYDKDTYLVEDSPYIAKLAAGGCCILADAIMTGEISRGFALVRPPGHHAEAGRGMGFCIFNNIAITAKHLLEKHHLNRILIVDFDVHHSNGTQDIFYDSPEVLVLSIHQNNIFPFTGKGSEIGTGNGRGYNINIPVPPNFGNQEYSYIFGNIIQNVVDNYLPQVILVSAGFDAHTDDVMGKTDITTEGFGFIAKTLRYFASRHCDDKLLYVLEGGYHIPSLWTSVKATLDVFLGSSTVQPGFNYSAKAKNIIDIELSQEIRQKWALL